MWVPCICVAIHAHLRVTATPPRPKEFPHNKILAPVLVCFQNTVFRNFVYENKNQKQYIIKREEQVLSCTNGS